MVGGQLFAREESLEPFNGICYQLNELLKLLCLQWRVVNAVLFGMVDVLQGV